MSIKTQCPNCHARFTVADDYVGRKAKCKRCTEAFTIEVCVESPSPPIDDDPVPDAEQAPHTLGTNAESPASGQSWTGTMSLPEKYYQHSGTVGLMGPIYMLVVGVVASAVLGAVYGYAIFYIPFVYLNFFITLGFGGIVGFLVGLGGKWGKVRNPGVVLLFGLLIGLFAEYAGWVSWISALTGRELFLTNPFHILSFAKFVADRGAWGIFGWTPQGIWLYLFWGVEGVMIVGASALVSWGMISSTPFCEPCNCWVEEKDTIGPLEPIARPDALRSQLEQGDFGAITNLTKADAQSPLFTRLELVHCTSCEQVCFLTVQAVKMEVDSKGKEKTDETAIVEHLVVTPQTAKMIKDRGELAMASGEASDEVSEEAPDEVSEEAPDEAPEEPPDEPLT